MESVIIFLFFTWKGCWTNGNVEEVSINRKVFWVFSLSACKERKTFNSQVRLANFATSVFSGKMLLGNENGTEITVSLWWSWTVHIISDKLQDKNWQSKYNPFYTSPSPPRYPEHHFTSGRFEKTLKVIPGTQSHGVGKCIYLHSTLFHLKKFPDK